MKETERILLAVLIGAGASLAGCEEGAFERGGEKMDQATERAGEAVEDAGDRVHRD